MTKRALSGQPAEPGWLYRDRTPPRGRRARHDSWLVIAAGAALLAIALPDIAFGAAAVAGASYALVALAASAVLDVRSTSAVAAVAVVLAALSGVWNQNLGSLDWLIRLVLAALLAALAVGLAVMRVHREQEIRRLALVADAAQQAVLRRPPQQLGAVAFAAQYQSATEAAMVGGDLFEVVDSPHGTRVVVGDVRGKGLEAVHLSATVMAAFRWAAVTEPSLEKIAVDLDTVVRSLGGDEDFVTAVLGEFHSHEVALVNCGHPPPLLVIDHEVRLINTGEPNLPLGLGSLFPAVIESWPSRSRILFYTDGLAESRDSRGRFFPLLYAARLLREGPLDAALDSLLTAVDLFAGHRREDDVAVLLAEHQPRAAEASGPAR